MSRTRNAEDLRERLKRIFTNYEGRAKPQIDALRRRLTDLGIDSAERAKHNAEYRPAVEAQTRTFLIDPILKALNWTLVSDPEDIVAAVPDVLPETAVRSAEKDTIRRLDYLGIECTTCTPLLLVEAKREDNELPRTDREGGVPDWLSRCLSRKLEDSSEWAEWLGTLRDYVQSLKASGSIVPKRVVITNGEWLVLFLDPADAFLSGGTCNPTTIKVFRNRNDCLDRANELYLDLEHQSLLDNTQLLKPGEVAFYVRGAEVERVMYGIHLVRSAQQRVHLTRPEIVVAPVLFLGTANGAWIGVEGPEIDYDVPHTSDGIVDHIDRVAVEAERLLVDVQGKLKKAFHLVPVDAACGGEEASDLPGLRILRKDGHHFIPTGSSPHFIGKVPTVPGCAFHDWRKCDAQGVACGPSPIMRPSASPPSHFCSGSEHHCAHRDVEAAKAISITAQNTDLAGPVWGEEAHPFCRLWVFEQMLCCRTCVYEMVCERAPGFHLPCARPSTSG